MNTAKKRYFDYLESKGKMPKKMADGGMIDDEDPDSVGGASTSTTGNKTKTGGSNPGGASTGGAGTVTITTGKSPVGDINISGIGGTTESRNAGGMDPSDEDDEMMKAYGGRIGKGYSAGGIVGDEYDPEYNIDKIHGNASDFNSSGEPHTDDRYSDEHPMEFMDHGEIENYDDSLEYGPNGERSPRLRKGGIMQRMARGGRVPSPSFAKALRRGY